MEKQIAVLHRACEHLGLETRFVDSNQNVMQVQFPWGYEYFRINRTPFNSEVVAEICRDKMHTYELLSSHINLPFTRSYLDVNVAPKYRQYLTHTSLEAIVADVEQHFSLPVVVKMNSGALGTGVFLCESPEQVRNAFQTIFNQQSSQYDYVALAQQYIPNKLEYRLVCAFNEPVLVYQRGQAAGFNARYWENQEVAINVSDPEIIERLMDFINPIYQTLSAGFAGFDIIQDEQDNLHLIEINSAPKFNHFLENNDPDWVLNMYCETLTLFIEHRRA